MRGVLRYDDAAAGRSSLCIYIYIQCTIRALYAYYGVYPSYLPPASHPSTDPPRARVARAAHRRPARTHRGRFPRAETARRRHGRKNQNPGDGRRLETTASILNKYAGRTAERPPRLPATVRHIIIMIPRGTHNIRLVRLGKKVYTNIIIVV